MDEEKGMTLIEISRTVEEINNAINERKQQLAPQIKKLRTVRQDFAVGPGRGRAWGGPGGKSCCGWAARLGGRPAPGRQVPGHAVSLSRSACQLAAAHFCGRASSWLVTLTFWC
jgi:hypothetical protein